MLEEQPGQKRAQGKHDIEWLRRQPSCGRTLLKTALPTQWNIYF